MSSVVFILGAGASAQGGAPLMANFLDVADQLWKSGEVKDKADRFKAVFKGQAALQSVHSKSELDITNIEAVFAAFEMAKLLQKMPGHNSKKTNDLIIALKEVIVETLNLTIQFPANDRGVHAPPPYDSFCELLKFLLKDTKPIHTIAIITFNYDMAADFAMHSHGMGPDYCIDGPSSPRSLPLLKLHGSLNWARCKKCGKVVPWNLAEYFKKYHWNFIFEDVTTVQLEIGKNLHNFQHCDQAVVPEPVLVPPTWNKSAYHQDLARVWSRAAKELSDAEYIFVIGYSLPDTDIFFRYLYALGTVGDTPIKRFWVFDPDSSGNVGRRFESMLGPGAKDRYLIYQDKFHNAIPIIRESFK